MTKSAKIRVGLSDLVDRRLGVLDGQVLGDSQLVGRMVRRVVPALDGSQPAIEAGEDDRAQGHPQRRGVEGGEVAAAEPCRQLRRQRVPFSVSLETAWIVSLPATHWSRPSATTGARRRRC